MQHYEGECRYKRQTSCPSHYGHVRLIAAPAPDDVPFTLRWQVDENIIPREFADAVRAGVLLALAEARYPQSLTVTIVGGSYHPIDSQRGDYREAARRAMYQALARMTPGSSK